MMSIKTVLVLGGGIGGIVTANELRDRLASEHRVVVVEKRADYVFTPSLLWTMVGWRRPEQITKAVRRLVRPGVEVKEAQVQAIDVESSRVRTGSGELDYDYLVVALGADLSPGSLPGFSEAAFSPYDLQGSIRLLEALQRFEGGRVVVLVSSMPYKCPAAPYETALLLDDYLRRKGIRDRCELEVFTPETLPMGVAGAEMGRAVVGLLETKSIRFNPEVKATKISSDPRELVFSNRKPVAFDFLAGVPPHGSPPAVKESVLANEAGWIPVDRRTLGTQYDNIYAIGDVAAVTLANGKPLPKAGVFAEGQGRTVAHRIAEEIEGARSRTEFDGRGFCWIETGGGLAGFASGEFYAEPDPVVGLPKPGRIWHWGKMLFEKYWLAEGMTHAMAKMSLRLGSKVLGVSARL
jgi:sulfide:quinone oxidoreductase